MKMRLIDADKLLDLIATENQRCITSTGHELTVKIINDFIKCQPTAYDVDKVVDQLKSKKFTEQETILCDVHQGFNSGVEFSIEIAKAGGVNE